MMAAGLLALLTPLIFVWQGNWLAAACIFLIFAGVSSYIWFSGRQAEGSRASRVMPPAIARDHHLEQELQQLERRIQEQIQHFQRQQLQQLSYQEAAATTVAFTSFDRSQIPNVPLQALQPHLDAWFREAEKSKHQHIEQLRKLEKLRDARENLHTLGEHHAQRLRYAEEVQAETRKLQSSWQEWLQELGLGPHLSTDALLETILVIEQAQEGLRQLHKMASKLDIITGNVHSFEDTVSTLLDLPPSYHDCLFALKRWKEAGAAAARTYRGTKAKRTVTLRGRASAFASPATCGSNTDSSSTAPAGSFCRRW